MMPRILASAVAALFLVAYVERWERSRPAPERGAPTNRLDAAPPAPGYGDSATVAIVGTLSAAALRGIGVAAPHGQTLLVVLRARDRTVCEDLGRQLRELTRTAGAGVSLLVVTDAASADTYRRYLRREHVHASVVLVHPDSVLVGTAIPSPAVLVRRSGAKVHGVAHPMRFPNLRLRSFATEVARSLHRDAATRGRDGAPTPPEGD